MFFVCVWEWASCAPGLNSLSGSGSWLLRSREQTAIHTHTAVGAGMGCQRRVNREKDRPSQGGREREEGATKQSFMRAGRRPAQSIFGSAPLLIVLSV